MEIVDCLSVVDIVDVFCLIGVFFRSGIVIILWNCGMLGDLYDNMVVYGVLIMDGVRGIYF